MHGACIPRRPAIELHDFSPAQRLMKAGADDFVPLAVPVEGTTENPPF